MSGKSILIINEDRWQVKTLGRILEERGYRVYTAKSGEEGIREVEQINPDLITLDVNNGMERLETDIYMDLIFSSEMRNIPVIFISHNDREMYMTGGTRDCPDECISKPFKPAELLETVYDLIGD
ncbi:MAG: response regulator [Actinobacteria bacterium]|nr:response regulator [Actinomycetota bacterium]